MITTTDMIMNVKRLQETIVTMRERIIIAVAHKCDLPEKHTPRLQIAHASAVAVAKTVERN